MMFWKRKKQAESLPGLLRNQALGGQSVLYLMFRETLGVEDSKIHRMELTYFELAVLTGAFMSTAAVDDKQKHMDAATLQVLHKSLPSARDGVSIEQAISQYQSRYREHGALIVPLFDGEKEPNPATTLIMHLYECVTGESARGKMVLIAAASDLINQFVLDHIDFVRERVNKV